MIELLGYLSTCKYFFFLQQVMKISFKMKVELGVMVMKGYSILPRFPELEPHCQMQFRVIPKILFIFGGVLILCRGYNQYLVSLGGKGNNCVRSQKKRLVIALGRLLFPFFFFFKNIKLLIDRILGYLSTCKHFLSTYSKIWNSFIRLKWTQFI